MRLRIGILTVSDRASSGEITDAGGPAVMEALSADEWVVERQAIVSDDRSAVASVLIRWVDSDHLDVIFTTGGTGLSPRDVTPEATLDVAHRNVPGIAEAIRVTSANYTLMAMLSRGVSILRDRTLIINLPGSPRGAVQAVDVVRPVLEHAIATIRGATH